MRISGVARVAVAAFAVAAGFVSGAAADDFYKGSNVSLVVATGPGGGYSQIGLIMARHMPNHIPGHPTIVVQHMERAGGLQAANYLYNAALADGSVFGLLRNATAFGQALGTTGIKYDVRKFRWIGSTGPLINVLAVRKDSGIASIADLEKKQLIVGSSGVKIDTLFLFPTVMAKMFGHKIKVVSGYKGTNDVQGAVERGEVSGEVQPYQNWDRSHLVENGTVIYLLQYAYERVKALPNVPTLVELARNDEERKILRLVSSPSVTGRNFAAPPKIPAERLAILRKAFDDTVRDKAFIADMTKLDLEVEPRNGPDLEKLIAEVMDTPPHLIQRTRSYLGY